MGKPTTYLNEEDDGDFFNADDFDSTSDSGEPEPTRRREPKVPQRFAARQRLDSRKEDLWLKAQLSDWSDEIEDVDRAG